MKKPWPAPETLPSFVGRERELERLGAEIDEAASEGRGRVVLVSGESGIGKTWLLRAALSQAATRLRRLDVRWARCSDAGGAPAYWPWRRLLGRAFDEAWGDPAEVDDAERFERLHRVAETVARIGESRPLALVVDDLQWADEGSLVLLEEIAREIDFWRVIVLATVRDAGVGSAAVSLGTQKCVRPLRLGGFDVSETRQLAEAVMGESPEAPIVDALRRLTGGNPYFAGEILRSSSREELRELTRTEVDPEIPSDLEAMIRARIETCDPETRAMLEVAAVIGPKFPVAWLGPLGSPTEGGRNENLLARALDARLVEPTGEHGHLRFVHGLVRSGILHGLTVARRAQLEGRVGQLLQRAGVGGRAASAAELAHHFVGAATLPEFAEAAVVHARRAGDEAARHHAHDLAARHYEDALSVLATLPVPSDAEGADLLHPELIVGLGQALAHAGRPGAEAALDEAERRAASALGTDAHDRAARILVLASITRCEVLSPATAPECREAWARGKRALDALGTSATTLRARLLAALTPLQRFESNRGPARALATEANDLAAAVEDASLQGRALAALHWALFDDSPAGDRLRIASRVLQRAESADDPRLASTARFWRYLDLVELGRITDAETELAQLEKLADRLGEPRRQHQARYLRAGLDLHRGHFERAEEHAAEAHRLGTSVGIGDADVIYLTAMSAVCFARNDLARIGEIHREITERRSKYPQAYPGAPILLAWQGQIRSAEEELSVALTSGLGAIPRGPGWLGTMQTLALSAIELDLHDLSRAVYDRLRGHSGRTVVHHLGAAIGGTVARVLGSLARHLGRIEEADAHFRHATTLAAKSESAWDLTFLPLERATLEIARGRDRDDPIVVRLLTDALERARQTGAIRVEDQVRELSPALLAAAGPHVDRLAPYHFVRRGRTWTVAFEGRACQVPDGRGLHFLAALLRRPGEEILAADLVTEITGETHVPIEAARLRVTQRIRSVMTKLRTDHPAMAAHLGNYVRTGKYCCYLPRAEDRVEWQIDARSEDSRR